GERFCTVVLVAAICEVAANPTTNNTTIESQKILDCEKIRRHTEQISDIAAIHFANPLYVVRAANCRAPSTAPTPAALIRKPSPRAPECRTPSAKIGMNTEYCRPNRLNMLINNSVERIGLSLMAKRNPFNRLCSGDSPELFCTCGSIFMAIRAKIT